METLEFLNQDFSESHNQLRHYDNIILDSFKFIFSIYIALIGGAISLLNIENEFDFTFLIEALIIFSIILCTFIIFYVVEQRIYFVKTARYINEIRHYFLAENQVHFRNQSKYYSDCLKPDFFNLKSSHIILTFIISILNSFNVGLLIYVINNNLLLLLSAVVIVTLLLQTSVIFLILKRK